MTVYKVVPTAPLWMCTAVRPQYPAELRRLALKDLETPEMEEPDDPQPVYAMLVRVQAEDLDRCADPEGYFTESGYTTVRSKDYVAHVSHDRDAVLELCRRVNRQQLGWFTAEWERREAAGEVEA